MLRIIFKALITFWPFLKNVIFKDRTVREAIRANKQFTILFALLILVITTLLLTVYVLSNVKEELRLYQREIETLQHTNRRTQDDLMCEVETEPPPDLNHYTYDKEDIIQLLLDQ